MLYVHILYPVMTRRVGSDYTSYAVSRRTVHQAIPGWRRLRTDTYPGGMRRLYSIVFSDRAQHGRWYGPPLLLVRNADQVYIPSQTPLPTQFHQALFRGGV